MTAITRNVYQLTDLNESKILWDYKFRYACYQS